MSLRNITAFAAVLAIAFVVPSSDVLAGKTSQKEPVITGLPDTALGGLGSGSTIGPDGALYVTNGNDGTLVRIDPTTGSATVVGSGLPRQTIGIGGAMDVVFIEHRAYVLVAPGRGRRRRSRRRHGHLPPEPRRHVLGVRQPGARGRPRTRPRTPTGSSRKASSIRWKCGATDSSWPTPISDE